MSEQAVTVLTSSFFDVTGLRLPVTSQLNMFNLLSDPDKTQYLNIFRTYTINDDAKNNAMMYYTHEVGQNEWWEYISYKYYETVDLWWLIATMNDVVNPFEELEEGTLIKILKPEFIYQSLKDIDLISRL